MRWADMDLLGHVNNVTYLDYVAEARENLFPGSPAGRAPVTRHQVEFVSPLVFRRRPVLVDSWVTDVSDDEPDPRPRDLRRPADAGRRAHRLPAGRHDARRRRLTVARARRRSRR